MTASRIPSVEGGIQPTILTAKGDLLTASATSTITNLPVGTDGQTLVANSSATTGMSWAGPIYTAGKNFLINGGFDIWQRGTSFATSSGYFADRWTNYGTVSNITTSRQSSGAPVGSQYFCRHTSTAASSFITSLMFLESSQTAPLLGQTVTFSMKVRANSTMTSAINVNVDKSSTVDAGGASTWVNLYTSVVSNASLQTGGSGSSNWYTTTGTFTVPNDGSAVSLRINISYQAAVASGSTLDFANVQLEIGSVATSFSRAGGTLQGELAACQRYYYRTTPNSGYSRFGLGQCSGTTAALAIIPFPVQMRIAPSALEQTGTASNYAVTNTTQGIVACSSVPTFDGASVTVASVTFTVASGIAAGNVTQLLPNNNTAAYLGWSAEL